MMVALDFNTRKILAYPRWLAIQDHIREMTEEARALVALGVYRRSDLVGQAQLQPGYPRAVATGWAIDCRAKCRPWRTWWPVWRAMAYLQRLRDRGDAKTLEQGLALVRTRFPATSKRPGFDQIAAVSWLRAGDWIREGTVGCLPWYRSVATVMKEQTPEAAPAHL
ncbi:MAG: hypothetical protein ACYC6N_06570 [Pirellulaceae bacterium]